MYNFNFTKVRWYLVALVALRLTSLTPDNKESAHFFPCKLNWATVCTEQSRLPSKSGRQLPQVERSATLFGGEGLRSAQLTYPKVQLCYWFTDFYLSAIIIVSILYIANSAFPHWSSILLWELVARQSSLPTNLSMKFRIVVKTQSFLS